MLTDDDLRQLREAYVKGGYGLLLVEVIDELLERRRPWRPIAELPLVEQRDGRLMLVCLEGEKAPFIVRWYQGYWRCTKGSFDSGDFTHFMEIPELEESDA